MKISIYNIDNKNSVGITIEIKMIKKHVYSQTSDCKTLNHDIFLKNLSLSCFKIYVVVLEY